MKDGVEGEGADGPASVWGTKSSMVLMTKRRILEQGRFNDEEIRGCAKFSVPLNRLNREIGSG